ncbi:MAG: fibronectin type III domain-containing protein [Armatimonadetes bacterium]|nr:fibronectin type III domain-containing protein [Armatimonadota bacterium]
MSVAPASPTAATLTWTFAGCSDFTRFELEQQAATGEWRTIVVLSAPSARNWTGQPLSPDVSLPFRVTAYDNTGAGESSNGLRIE